MGVGEWEAGGDGGGGWLGMADCPGTPSQTCCVFLMTLLGPGIPSLGLWLATLAPHILRYASLME